MKRPDWEAALKIPFGHLPGGMSESIFCCSFDLFLCFGFWFLFSCFCLLVMCFAVVIFVKLPFLFFNTCLLGTGNGLATSLGAGDGVTAALAVAQGNFANALIFNRSLSKKIIFLFCCVRCLLCCRGPESFVTWLVAGSTNRQFNLDLIGVVVPMDIYRWQQLQRWQC